MDLNELYERARRIFISVACFITAVFLIHRGQNSDIAGSSAIVPLMLILTAFTVGAVGLVTILRDEPKAEN